jgi:hypothetical protein
MFEFAQGELAIASWCISQATGSSVMTDAVRGALESILDLAVSDGALTNRRRNTICSRLRSGTPPRRRSPPPAPPFLGLIAPFLAGVEADRRCFVVGAPVTTAVGAASDTPTDDQHAAGIKGLVALLTTAIEGNPSYATGSSYDQAALLDKILAILSSLGYDATKVDLNHAAGGVDPLAVLAGGAPVDVLVVPPIGRPDKLPVTRAIQRFVDMLGCSPRNDLQIAASLDVILPAMVASNVAPGSRILWVGHQTTRNEPRWLDTVRGACHETLIRTCCFAEVAHFMFRCTPFTAEWIVPFGGHVLHHVHVGDGDLLLRVVKAQSWIDWFVRVRPVWFRSPPRHESPASDALAAVAVKQEDEALPWTNELFGPAGRAFRHSFLPYGRWITLGDLGDFKQVILDDTEYHWLADAGNDAESVPLVESLPDIYEFDRSNAAEVLLDPAHRTEWEPCLLAEGDLLFQSEWDAERQELSHTLAIVPSAAAGALAPLESDLIAFAFDPSIPRPIRLWVSDFLQSPLADRWARMLNYDEGDNRSVFYWTGMLLPQPDDHLLAAYLSATDAAAKLRVAASKIDAERDKLFAEGAEPDRWNRLRGLAARAVASDFLAETMSTDELGVRVTFPLPLGVGFRGYRSQTPHAARFRAGLLLGENAAALLGAYWLALQDTLKQPVQRYYRQMVLRGCTFGSHLKLLEEHALLDFQHGPFGQFLLRDDFCSFIAVLRGIKRLRDQHSHHLKPSPDSAADDLDTLDRLLGSLLIGFAPFAAVQLVLVEKANNDPVTNICHSFRARRLAGDHPDGWHMAETAPRSGCLLPHVLYLSFFSREHRQGNQASEPVMRPAAPFIQYREDANGAPDVGVLQKIDADVPLYRSLLQTNAWQHGAARAQLATRMPEVFRSGQMSEERTISHE